MMEVLNESTTKFDSESSIKHLPNANNSIIMDEELLTPIQNFYENCNIFITGGTGFLGKSKYFIFLLLNNCYHLMLIDSKFKHNTNFLIMCSHSYLYFFHFLVHYTYVRRK